ncbi:MAG: hypothetical protein AAF191_21095, partial [Verrucomicrobiota bacterium]
MEPLHAFYAKRHLPITGVQFVPGETLPKTDRELLVHDRDMTPTLAAFHQSPLSLEVQEYELIDGHLHRLVVLRRLDSRAAVECGAI